jgi:hypothetical protein
MDIYTNQRRGKVCSHFAPSLCVDLVSVGRRWAHSKDADAKPTSKLHDLTRPLNVARTL